MTMTQTTQPEQQPQQSRVIGPVFTEARELAKAKRQTRALILQAAGVPADAKNVRLTPRLMRLEAQHGGGGEWLNITSNGEEMQDYVRSSKLATAYRLTAPMPSVIK